MNNTSNSTADNSASDRVRSNSGNTVQNKTRKPKWDKSISERAYEKIRTKCKAILADFCIPPYLESYLACIMRYIDCYLQSGYRVRLDDGNFIIYYVFASLRLDVEEAKKRSADARRRAAVRRARKEAKLQEKTADSAATSTDISEKSADAPEKSADAPESRADITESRADVVGKTAYSDAKSTVDTEKVTDDGGKEVGCIGKEAGKEAGNNRSGDSAEVHDGAPPYG